MTLDISYWRARISCGLGFHVWKRAQRVMPGSTAGVKRCKRCGWQRAVTLRAERTKQASEIVAKVDAMPASSWP